MTAFGQPTGGFTDDDVDRICKQLRDKGLIEYDETTRQAALTPAGREHLGQR